MPPFPILPGVRFAHVPDWVGYAASDDGRIWSCKKRQFRRIKMTADGKFEAEWRQLSHAQYPTKDGYIQSTVFLREGGRKGRNKNFRVSELVLLAFVGPPAEGQEVRHFPEADPRNNRLSNLLYGTRKENMNDRKIQGTEYRGSRHHNAKLNETSVKVIRFLVKSGLSQSFVARMFKMRPGTISEVVHRIYWSYVEDEKETRYVE